VEEHHQAPRRPAGGRRDSRSVDHAIGLAPDSWHSNRQKGRLFN
jgi:hypothetical protein